MRTASAEPEPTGPKELLEWPLFFASVASVLAVLAP